MSKPRNRAAIFQRLTGLAGRPQPVSEPPLPKPSKVPSRKDKKGFTVWLEPEVIKAIKQLAVETDRTQESLLREALNGLFKSHGKPPIA
jgi:hypothetical protein